MSRVLIALHGQLIKRSVLKAVLDYCMKMKFKVNVLLVDGPDAPSPALAYFLDGLKQAGLSGCLYRKAGSLGQAVLDHARRHKDIRLILVDSMKHWGASVPDKILTQPIGLFSGVIAT